MVSVAIKQKGAMKIVTLVFCNTERMSDFILGSNISAVEANSRALTVRGEMSDDAIAKACIFFDAELILPTPSSIRKIRNY